MDPPVVAEGERPGVKPGLTPLEALRSAERTLADAEARLSAIEAERAQLDRETVTWKQIADRMRGLVQYYQQRIRLSPEPDALVRAEQHGVLSVERFGKIVMPIADGLIQTLHRPVSVDEIFESLPAEVQAELRRTSSTYSPQHRIRRMFRRNKKYLVDTRGVTFASSASQPKNDLPNGGLIEMILRRPDGGIAAFQITSGDETIQVDPVTVRAALRAGKTLILNPSGKRKSLLKLAGNRFYSDADGVENDDFKNLPEHTVEAVAGSTLGA